MKVLVLGASGFLGSAIYTKLQELENVNVIGTCFNNAEHSGLYKLDVLCSDEVACLFDKYSIDVVIWSLVDIENEMSLSEGGLSNVLSNINDNTRFLYVSITVSTGSMQSEDATPQKRAEGMYNTNYVNGKILGESMVATHANHVIVRSGSIYGVDGFGRLDSRTITIKGHIRANEIYHRTANMFTTFVHVDDLADAIIELSTMDYVGKLNIAGSKPVSHYEFSVSRAKELGLSSEYIVADYVDERVEYSLDTRLASSVLEIKVREIY